MKSISQSTKKGLILHIFCALIVMAFAFIVRTPSATLTDREGKIKEAYIDEEGLPYLTDMDSYYHARRVDEQIKNGYIGNTLTDEGELWDSRSFYPEGRTAEYQPGIVYLTAALWRFVNLFKLSSIRMIEFVLPVLMSALCGLAAYIIVGRVSNKTGGIVAGLLTASAPLYTSRTCFGRFDTDMFVLLLDLLLILFVVEILLAEEKNKQYIYAAAYVVAAFLYSKCWTPTNSMLFSGITLAGGLLSIAISSFKNGDKLQVIGKFKCFLKKRETILLVATGVIILLAVGITSGFSSVLSLFPSLSYKTTADITEGSIPNLYVSVSELKKAAVVPDDFVSLLFGYVPGADITVVGGVGGGLAALASIAGLVWLGYTSFADMNYADDHVSIRKKSQVCFGILLIWSLAAVYMTRSGMRFVEMLSVPVGLLAGICLGELFRYVSGINGRKRIAAKLLSIVVILAVVLPAAGGAVLISAANIPSATDASANAMRWIRDNAEDPDAVIESWWDMGYYYESESGHPCLWDGGSQDGVRAILYSRAMTAGDMELSYRILYMLACSGNKAIDMLMEHTDAKTAFDVIWEALKLDKDSACTLIADKCGMNEAEAAEAEALIHPQAGKEIYLVLTYTMTKQLGWYEFYSDWDFTGTQELPNATWYSYMPDGTPVFLTETGQEYLQERRGNEVMWRLFFNAEENPYFIPAYEWHDGVEHVRIWRINGT